VIEPELSVRQFLLEKLYDDWLYLATKYPEPTKGQKSAITRAWNKFAKQARNMDRNPYTLARQWAQS
jgi:hypothetical protein